MKQVLYLSYDGMTDPLGQSQVLPYLVGLSKLNNHFTLISFEKPERFEQHRGRIEAICKAANIRWIPLTYTKKPAVISTLRDIRKMRRLAYQLHHEKPFNLVHCRSYITALIGISMKRSKSVPFLFDMRGFWPDERVEGGIWRLENPIYRLIYRFFKRKERQYLTMADGVISLTKAGKESMLTWDIPELDAEKIAVIPCCVDLEKFNPVAVNTTQVDAWKKQYQLEDKFVVGYVGSIGTWYMLSEMIQVFKQICNERREAVFVFLTQEDPQMIFEEVARQGLSREQFRAFPVAHHEVPAAITLFDCSIFFILPSFSKTASSPTKQAELMAMGIPIICNAGVGDTASIIRDYHAGMVVDSLDSEVLHAFKLNWENFDKTASMAGARTVFALEHGVKAYASMYDQLLTKRK